MLRLKRFEEAVRHIFPEAEGVSMTIKPLSPLKLRELRASSRSGKIAVKMPEGEDEKIRIVDDYDDLAFERKMFWYCLESWEGIEFDNGLNPSREQMLEAMFENVRIRQFVFLKAFENMEAERSKLEQELKNSESSQRG